MRKIIFDLDLTLVDTSLGEEARKKRNWSEVYSLIPQFSLYEGMDRIFQLIREHNIQAVIVSTAPKPYIERIVNFFNIPVVGIIGYHDVKQIKPNPESMLKALEMLGCDNSQAISFGDRVIDIEASNAANIESVACVWGTKEKSDLIESNYRHLIKYPQEILTLIR